ncbi:hypothetical protein SPHINGO361_100051 [Sphingomonas sp. EC-HK361]|nr:hypothetical protein SPHINGO361_100051 [Sphingomonas sp. EC-HK361]
MAVGIRIASIGIQCVHHLVDPIRTGTGTATAEEVGQFNAKGFQGKANANGYTAISGSKVDRYPVIINAVHINGCNGHGRSFN